MSQTEIVHQKALSKSPNSSQLQDNNVHSKRTIHSSFSFFLNLFSLVTVSLGIYLHYAYAPKMLPPSLVKAGANQFFTVLSGWLTITYQLLSVVSYLTGIQAIYRLKNNYILPTALTAEFLVSLVYWGLILFLPFISFQLEQQIPFFIDFSVHITPFVALCIDYLCFVPRIETHWRWIWVKCTAAASAYWYWLKWIIDETTDQKYPYVFLNVEPIVRAGIFAGIVVVGCLAYMLIRLLQEKLSKG